MQLQHIEIAVPSSFNDQEHTTYDAVDQNVAIGPASPVSRHEMARLLETFRDDIHAAYGKGNGTIDEAALDWPDLAETYAKACQLLNRLTPATSNSTPNDTIKGV